MDENEISKHVVDSAYRIHSALGPGQYENVYEEIMVYELGKRGLNVESQVALPLVYETVRMQVAYRADLLVNGKVIVELKSIDKIADIHKKQLLTYLRLSNL